MKLQLESRVSWGMLIGEDTGKYIENLIDEHKKEIRLSLERVGFNVIDQHFIHECEWGRLITWAELVENPENITHVINGVKSEFGYFLDEEKQRQFLNLKKLNRGSK